MTTLLSPLRLSPSGPEIVGTADGDLLFWNPADALWHAGVPSLSPGLSNVQVFFTPGTYSWVKPAGFQLADIYVFPVGAGGGSGSTIASNPGGGTSGAANGPLILHNYPVSALGDREVVIIGANSLGGAAVTPGNNGNNGSLGGTTSFGSLLQAIASLGGNGGTSFAPSVVAVTGIDDFTIVTGTNSPLGSTGIGNTGTSSVTTGPPSGGNGAGTSVAAPHAGGIGGINPFATAAAGGLAGGGRGQDGASFNPLQLIAGNGGGGGGSTIDATPGGDGGNGGFPSGSGGGGGAAAAAPSGKGGDGGGALVVVISH